MHCSATNNAKALTKGLLSQHLYPIKSATFCIAALILIVVKSDPALASDSIEKARVQACREELNAPSLTSIFQHAEEGEDTKKEIRALLKSWVPAYNRYSTSSSAMVLRKFADQNYKKSRVQTYKASTCRALKPLLYIATSAYSASESGLSVKTGYVLASCGKTFCIPKSISVIADRCDYQPYSVPFVTACE